MNYVIDFDYKILLVFLSLYLLLVLFMKFKLKKDMRSIVAFSLLYFYIVFLIKETQFDIYINNPEMEKELGSVAFGRDINIVPFKDFFNITTLLNVLIFIPIGFLQGFLYKASWLKTLIVGFGLSLMIESSQLLVRIFVGINFRKIDVNDLICNTIGTMIGFALLLLFVKILKKLIKKEGVIREFLESMER